jgi:hypothetical protein
MIANLFVMPEIETGTIKKRDPQWKRPLRSNGSFHRVPRGRTYGGATF